MLFYWFFVDDCPREIVAKRKMAIGSSFESSPQILSQEQQMIIPQYLTIIYMTDSVNNMIPPHVRYSIPERFATFQLILTNYKNEVQPKEVGGHTKWRQHLTDVE